MTDSAVVCATPSSIIFASAALMVTSSFVCGSTRTHSYWTSGFSSSSERLRARKTRREWPLLFRCTQVCFLSSTTNERPQCEPESNPITASPSVSCEHVSEMVKLPPRTATEDRPLLIAAFIALSSTFGYGTRVPRRGSRETKYFPRKSILFLRFLDFHIASKQRATTGTIIISSIIFKFF